MKVYLDDERTPPEGWELVKTVPELIKLMSQETIEQLSLDHDLGEDQLTGYDFLKWLEAQVFFKRVTHLPTINIHSANPTGRINMALALRSIQKIYGK